MADERVEINDEILLSEIQRYIQPYLAYDRGGKCIEALSKVALGIYKEELAQLSSRDPSASVSPKLARSASKQALQFNDSDEDPTINGFPVMPFKSGMAAKAMRDIWSSVTEADLLQMNGGLHPVDSMDKLDAQPIDFQTIKNGWLVYVSPGKYNIGVPDRDGGEELIYAANPKTKLPYVFNYGLMANELEQRRI